MNVDSDPTPTMLTLEEFLQQTNITDYRDTVASLASANPPNAMSPARRRKHSKIESAFQKVTKHLQPFLRSQPCYIVKHRKMLQKHTIFEILNTKQLVPENLFFQMRLESSGIKQMTPEIIHRIYTTMQTMDHDWLTCAVVSILENIDLIRSEHVCDLPLIQSDANPDLRFCSEHMYGNSMRTSFFVKPRNVAEHHVVNHLGEIVRAPKNSLRFDPLLQLYLFYTRIARFAKPKQADSQTSQTSIYYPDLFIQQLRNIFKVTES